MKTYIFIIIAIVFACGVKSQTYISGFVKELKHDNCSEEHEHLHLDPLVAANVFWEGTTKGTVTDNEGYFRFEYIEGKRLVISYVGYINDTIAIKNPAEEIRIVLAANHSLSEVQISEQLTGTYLSRMQPIHTQVITQAGLTRAACCNLAESFQSMASVDVAYSDAVSGARQIRLLGLSGIYSQILTENIPSIRGLSYVYGFGFIPGPWMESIHVSKGVTSVSTGYESITGQINVELKKPQLSEKLFINGYFSDEEKAEINLNTRYSMGKGWSGALLVHAENNNKPIDHNHDGFLDMPLSKQIHILKRFNYEKPGKRESMSGIQFLNDERTGGQKGYKHSENNHANDLYGINIRNERLHAFTKNGFILNKPGSSVGTILAATYHQLDATYGKHHYVGEQQSLHANILYQTPFRESWHELTSGITFSGDAYNEKFNDSIFNRQDIVPGAYTQLTLKPVEELTLMLAFRADYHQEFHTFFTPRLHLSYRPNTKHLLRISGGKGYRIPSAYAENLSYLASSKEWIWLEQPKLEEAYNAGVSYAYDFNINKKNATLVLDYYYTYFVNMLVADIDFGHNYIYLYNINNNAYSNSMQAELTFEPLKQLETVVAIRYNDVKAFTGNKMQEKALVSPMKALASLSYKTPNKKWQLDFTSHFNSGGRMPNEREASESKIFSEKLPSYMMYYAQITRNIKKWEIYLGGENLGNFTQKHPIIAADNPWGSDFDATRLWGPIMGRMFYGGFRFTI